MTILIGTDDGVYVDDDHHLDGRVITALVIGPGCTWAVADGRVVVRADARSGYHAWIDAVSPDDPPRCLLPTPLGLLIGTGGGNLAWWRDEGLVPIDAFDRADGRERWWQVPGLDLQPNTRSLAAAPDGTLYANVHVGGIYRSRDDGASWHPTIDQETDAHEVRAYADGLVLAATGMAGLCVSQDAAATWTSITDGFPAGGFGLPYARSVVRTGRGVVVTASNGPASDDAGVYRWAVGAQAVERCADGLPARFADNIDSGCLGTDGERVAFGTTEGSVYASDDGGRRWEEMRRGLPAVRSVVVT